MFDDEYTYASIAQLDANIRTQQDAQAMVTFWSAIRGIVTTPGAWPERRHWCEDPDCPHEGLDALLDLVRTARAQPEIAARAICILDLWLVRTRLEWNLP